ncbi:hypothetical protein KR093_011149 [Drosophila rubida]|uniref:Uncharacterized protein n=1 Tax=Drosophila rubida TaxID=30044 RepID=A0AAD4KHB9_9MUSC|nr:hypothetical protein KR093_011149 [Drosophila rubida]
MFWSKREEHFEAPKKHHGCHEAKSCGPWSKIQHHHHHHHHHIHINALNLEAVPQQHKHGHCHRSKHSGPWWAHKKFDQQPLPEHFHSACPLHQEAPPTKLNTFFRDMPGKEK